MGTDVNTISATTISVVQESPRTLLPARRVWERYGITDRSLDRWILREGLRFPKPVVINGRRYWYEAELSAWERDRRSAAERVA